MDNEKFGNFIVELRKENNMTQKELADKLHLTDKAISKWERGLSFPDISILKPLSEIFNVSVIELLNGERENIKEIDIDSRILTILKQAQHEKNKKIRKVICISIISIIIFITIFFIIAFSKIKLHTYNPIRALIGYIQVTKFDKEYVEVCNIPTKTIYANGKFNIEKYMKDKGYTKLGERTIKAGDDWYTNGENSVFIESFYRRGIMIYEFGYYGSYNEIKEDESIETEIKVPTLNIVEPLNIIEPINIINDILY